MSVDLAVQVAEDYDLAALSSRLSLAVGREVGIISLRDPGVPMIEELLRDAIVVHEGEYGAGATWRSRAWLDREIDLPWYERMLAAKLADLATRVGRIRLHNKPSAEELAGDVDAGELVAFNLMLAVQLCSDIARHIISDEKLPAVRSLSEAFTRLAEHRILTAETARGIGKADGFRNVVAHGYVSVDPSIVHRAARDGVADLERFAQEIARWSSAQA